MYEYGISGGPECLIKPHKLILAKEALYFLLGYDKPCLARGVLVRNMKLIG